MLLSDEKLCEVTCGGKRPCKTNEDCEVFVSHKDVAKAQLIAVWGKLNTLCDNPKHRVGCGRYKFNCPEHRAEFEAEVQKYKSEVK